MTGGGDGPDKSGRVANVEVLEEKGKRIIGISPQQDDVININLSQSSGLESLKV